MAIISLPKKVQMERRASLQCEVQMFKSIMVSKSGNADIVTQLRFASRPLKRAHFLFGDGAACFDYAAGDRASIRSASTDDASNAGQRGPMLFSMMLR